MIAGVVVLHVWALHVTGQTNPTGIEVKSKTDTVAFTPYATIKDGFRDDRVLSSCSSTSSSTSRTIWVMPTTTSLPTP